MGTTEGESNCPADPMTQPRPRAEDSPHKGIVQPEPYGRSARIRHARLAAAKTTWRLFAGEGGGQSGSDASGDASHLAGLSALPAVVEVRGSCRRGRVRILRQVPRRACQCDARTPGPCCLRRRSPPYAPGAASSTGQQNRRGCLTARQSGQGSSPR
jgi:hypothetical protein